VRLAIAVSFILALATLPAAWAHEGHTHKIMGTVAAVEVDRIEVATSDGRKVTIGLDEQTRFLVGKRSGVVADAKVGGRVVVISEQKDGRPVAREVLLPPEGASDR